MLVIGGYLVYNLKVIDYDSDTLLFHNEEDITWTLLVYFVW